ncbi:DUF624 domain-containing protein [Humibacillus xanthopallidus]|uniref:Uncharacterized protein DUF624 n=1 Tax=Humibacillus xanthopallidus TaxID=412689 RepID=A0A543HZS4_9MICO|nr:uncharacterized protein DUF624 [Humibacillus xanthopallidus]
MSSSGPSPNGGPADGPGSPGELPRWLALPGYLVVLNVLALVASLPVVTAASSAIALQRVLETLLRDGEPAPVVAFWRAWSRALRDWTLVGLALSLGFAGAAVSAVFWLRMASPVSAVALVFLLVAVAVATATWLAALECAAHANPPTVRGAVRLLAPVLVRSPLAAAGAAVATFAWLALVGQKPVILLVAGPMVPALVGRWAFHRRAASEGRP